MAAVTKIWCCWRRRCCYTFQVYTNNTVYVVYEV